MPARGTKSGNPKRAVAYLRVSTEEQELGPKAQRESLERWAKTQGLVIVGWHQDLGVSGGAPLDKRPGLMAALGELREADAGVLLVAKRDRLARDVVLAGMAERLAEKAGARIESADGVGAGDGPESQLMKSIVDAFAQYERALIRSRTKSALAVKKSRGERVGTVAYGLQTDADGIRLLRNPEELAALARVRALREAGLSIRAIVEAMNREGHRARGTQWHRTTIHRLLGRTA